MRAASWRQAPDDRTQPRRRLRRAYPALVHPAAGRPLATAAARDLPGETEVVTIELRELAHDIVNNLLTGFPSPALRKAIGQVLRADGLIAATPLYSGSYNGLFKSFFDVLDPDALAGKPVLIAATGGTARHTLALEHAIRPLFTYLRAATVPTAVFAATEDWGARRGQRCAAGPDRAGRRRTGRRRRPAAGRGNDRPVRVNAAVRRAAPRSPSLTTNAPPGRAGHRVKRWARP